MSPHPKHPSLYEINTRILLNTIGSGATLGDIPVKYWKELHSKGIDWVWLMGVWEIQEKALDPHLISDDMMRDFRALMPEITNDDISGSPYAIHDYVVDPAIGNDKQLKELRRQLHKLGMKLMLDFVPNHFGAHCRVLEAHPEYFIEVREAEFIKDQSTYYRPWYDRNRFFAHGKDPYFAAWQDTVQVNYANPATHVWMTETLEQIAEMCDGVRCDMAMLPVSRVFEKTWSHVKELKPVESEFWPTAIATVKKTHPEFLLLAECYWDMEAELMTMGFDYCYDKVFFDRMSVNDAEKLRLHFHAEPWWLQRTARFLENHDEHRATAILHYQKHMATAALVAFGPGMRFWHMGQWEGRRKKVPVQIDKYPHEPSCGCVVVGRNQNQICTCVQAFYTRLLELNQAQIFREGDWTVVHEISGAGVICWLWSMRDEHMLITVNHSETETAFSLSDQLHLLHMKEPKDVIASNTDINPHTIQSLAPWGVYVWKVKRI